MKQNQSNNKPIYKQWYFWFILIFILFIISLFIPKDQQNAEEKNSSNSTNSLSNTDKNDSVEPEKSQDLFDKCVVMEAADIQTAGGASSNENVFDKAAGTCASWFDDDYASYSQAAAEDWANRKDEVIEGQTLSEILKVYTENDYRAKI